MTKEEWMKVIDEYIVEENNKIGRTVRTGADLPGSWPQVHSMITDDVIKTFAWNIGSNNPLYTDRDYAGRSKWRTMIAPQGRFVHYIAETGNLQRGRNIPGQNHLYGGTEYEFFDVMRSGDSYTIRDEYLGVEEKILPPEKADKYRLLTMRSKRHYVRQDGKVVTTATGNTVITCTYPGDLKPGDNGLYKKEGFKKYGDEELDVVHNYYKEYFNGKYTRGARVRYYEEVSLGEKLPTMIKGPLDLMDMIGYLCAIGAQHGNGATKWNAIEHSLAVSPRDPKTNEYIHRQMMHLDSSVAQSMGFPKSLSYAAMTEAYVSEYVSDWMGDDAVMVSLSHRHRRPIFHGDLIYITGEVVNKYVEEGNCYAAIEIHVANQKGVDSCPSSAVVKLESANGKK